MSIIAHIKRSYEDQGSWCLAIAGTKAEELQSDLRLLFENENVTKSDILTLPMGEEVWEVAEEQYEKAKLLEIRDDKKWAREQASLEYRGLWQEVIHMQAWLRSSGRQEGTVQWRYNHDLDAPGLFVRTLEYLGIDLDHPVVMNVENKLPNTEDGEGQYLIPESEIDHFWEQGWLYVAGKTIFNVGDNPVGNHVRTWIGNMFPVHTDCASYVRRFRAALVKEGFLPNIKVRTALVMAKKRVGHDELSTSGVTLYEDVPQGADGSGLYDPAHPTMANLVTRYGPVNFQITAFTLAGKMWKGIVRPRAGINDALPPEEQAGIHFDHLQVKGSHKAYHKDQAELGTALNTHAAVMDEGVFVGIMKAKTHMGKVSSCFEVVEQLGPVGPFESAADMLEKKGGVRKLLDGFIAGSMERIRRLGPDGLLGRATRDDPKLKRMAQLLLAMNKQLPEGQKISPLSIPMLKRKLEDSLAQVLWTPAQGAGIRAKYPFAIIDDTIEPGTCVIAHYKAGTELAVFRFPNILAQGLTTVKVVKPSPHHLFEAEGHKNGRGEIVRNCVFLNSKDITLRMQGDDDGDEVGISDDPNLVELFKNRLNNDLFHIEPEGVKVEKDTWSVEGRRYIGGDPMGPVGLVTIWKAGLDAVGASDMALGFAVGCQEAIDSQKRLVRPSNPYKLANKDNWYQDSATDEYHAHHKVDGKYVTDNFLTEEAGAFPVELYSQAYEQTLIAHGCTRKIKQEDGTWKIVAGWPLGWRTQHRVEILPDGEEKRTKLRKKIGFRHWQESRRKQAGQHGNWVHYCHDRAMTLWKDMEAEWTEDQTIPARDLLVEALGRAGVEVTPSRLTWGEYAQGLREDAGLNWYGQEMKKLLATRGKEKEGTNEDAQASRLARIDRLNDELDIKMGSLTLQDLIDIWWMELTPTWWAWDGVGRKGTKIYSTNPEVFSDRTHYPCNTPNYAFKVASSGNSPISNLLGLKVESKCTFMTDRRPDLAKRIVDWCFTEPQGMNAYQAMTAFVRADKGHGKSKFGGNGDPIRLCDCKDCVGDLQAMLIRRVRSTRKAKELEGASALNTAMNAYEQDIIEEYWEQGETMARKDRRNEEAQSARDPWDTQENAC